MEGLGEGAGLCLGLGGGWLHQGLKLKLWAWAKYTLHPWVPVLASGRCELKETLLLESSLPSF